MRPWTTSHILYWETFPNLSRFLTNTHLQPIGLTPFGVVPIGLNTFLDIRDFGLDLMVSSHMGQSLQLRTSATIVSS